MNPGKMTPGHGGATEDDPKVRYLDQQLQSCRDLLLSFETQLKDYEATKRSIERDAVLESADPRRHVLATYESKIARVTGHIESLRKMEIDILGDTLRVEVVQ